MENHFLVRQSINVVGQAKIPKMGKQAAHMRGTAEGRRVKEKASLSIRRTPPAAGDCWEGDEWWVKGRSSRKSQREGVDDLTV